jgi:hypothetical protein
MTNVTQIDRAGVVAVGATAALLAGNEAAYHDLAAQAMAQYAGTTNFQEAANIGFLCLLTPDSVPDLEPVFKLVDLVPSGPDREMVLIKGMADYRRGDLAAALKVFEECGPPPAGYFRAMIHYRQKDLAAANAELAEANRQFELWVRTGDLGGYWYAIAAALCVRGEAERLILGHEVSPRIDAAWLASARKQWESFRRHLREAEMLAGERKWSAARDQYLAALGEPSYEWGVLDGEEIQRIGLIFALAGDRRNFEELMRGWFTSLEKKLHEGPINSFLATRACLTVESDAKSELGQLAWKFAPHADLDPVNYPFYSAVSNWFHALVAYRSGDYGKAIQEGQAAESSKGLANRNVGRIFRAMALAKSGRRDAGKELLAVAELELRGHLAHMTGDVWWDLGFCQLALDEAHQLFGTSSNQ